MSGPARRALAAALAAGLLGLAGCSDEPYVAPPSQVNDGDVADPTAASSTLADLEAAIAEGDAEAADALGANPAASSLLAALADNAERLDLTNVSFTYVTETGRTSGREGWDGLVAVTWQLRGHDPGPARTEVPFTFADGGREIAGVGSADARTPIWMSGPVQVRRVEGALVIAATSPARAAVYERRARRAVVQARKVLGKGRGTVVIEVPANQAALDRALDVNSGTYAAIAAITAPVDGSLTDRSQIHVFVNPAVYDALDAEAAQVVMTHEAVHALTGASLARRAPLWLVEGFADYVALRDIALPVSTTLRGLLDQVRRDGAPAQLPGDAEFDPAATHLGTVYEAAWQVTVTLANEGGEAALLRLYRSVLSGTSIDEALRTGFGWSQADLTRAWQQRLEQLARM